MSRGSPEINVPPIPAPKEMVDVDLGSLPTSGKDNIPIEQTVTNVKKEGFVIPGAILPQEPKSGAEVIIAPGNVLKGEVVVSIATPEIVK